MFQYVAAYLREQGWTAWSVVQVGRTSLVWWIFRPGESSASVVGKLPRTPLHVTLARKETEALRKLSSWGSHLHIPQLLLATDLPQGGFLFLQSGEPGRPLSDHGDHFARILPWLEAFQKIPAGGTAEEAYLRAARICRERVPDLTEAELLLLERGTEMSAVLRSLTACPVHGDFWPCNVLEEGARLSVVDWSNYQSGSPLEDLHNFAAAQGYSGRARTEEPMWSMWRVFFEQTPLMHRTHAATQQILRAKQISAEALHAFFILFLVRRIGCTEFSNHQAWRQLARHYVKTGMPRPFPPGS